MYSYYFEEQTLSLDTIFLWDNIYLFKVEERLMFPVMKDYVLYDQYALFNPFYFTWNFTHFSDTSQDARGILTKQYQNVRMQNQIYLFSYFCLVYIYTYILISLFHSIWYKTPNMENSANVNKLHYSNILFILSP